MPRMPRRAADDVLRGYFRAKDGNRPHLLHEVFRDTAALEMRVRAGAIAFPPLTRGIDGIADVLVRRFGQSFDNVYSFYLDRPAAGAVLDRFGFRWLVGMTAKADGAPRVGCGRYDWWFHRESGLAERLVITIEAMQVLPIRHADAVLRWVAGLPYPWCSARTAAGTAPALAELQPVLDGIGRGPSLA